MGVTPDGLYQYWFANGQLGVEATYKNGDAVHKQTWKADGTPLMETTYDGPLIFRAGPTGCTCSFLPAPNGEEVTIWTSEDPMDCDLPCQLPQCSTACAGKVCGPDGCGGVCGQCPTSYTCGAGATECIPMVP